MPFARSKKKAERRKAAAWLLPGAVISAGVVAAARRLWTGRQKEDYQVKRIPFSRRLIMDTARAGQRRHTISALIEVDVTRARQIMHAHREQTGETLSFTAFILACLGKAVGEHPYLHARRAVGGRLILFEQVDCNTLIEIKLEGHNFPMAHVIRAVNQRSFRSIHDEIRAIQATPEASASLQYPRWLMGSFLLLPTFMRDWFYSLLTYSPHLSKEQMGTVMVSSVGMFGQGSGWGLGSGSPYTTGVLVGGISEKPGVVDGQIKVREVLNITVDFDHDIVDGAPAARFVSRFKELLEEAYGLAEVPEGA